MPADHMADVQLGQFVLGEVQHRETLAGQAGHQRAARVVLRVGLHADENVRFAARVVAVIEFGDLAFAHRFAEGLEAARPLRDRHRDDGFTAFTQFGALGHVAQTVEVDVGARVDGDKGLAADAAGLDVLLIPATPSAPAGSVMERVSS